METTKITVLQKRDELELLRARVKQLEQAQFESGYIQTALQSSEERYRLLCETIPHMVWQTDALGNAVYHNQRWYEYTGQNFEEASTIGWQQAVHPEDATEVTAAWNKAVKQGQDYNNEYRLRRADGEYRWFLVRGMPVRNKQNQILAWFGTYTDINDEKELAHLKDLFVSVITHELRTPLTVIKGYVNSVQRQLHKNLGEILPLSRSRDKALHSLQIIQDQAGRMEGLITQLTDFSHIQNNQVELNRVNEVNLVAIIHKVVEQFGQALSNHRLEFVTLEANLTGFYDIARLEQILNNLISNALKYSPPQTTVTIGLERSQEANEAVFWVRDEGFGITAEHQRHVFDRFYRERTRQNRSVEGLGLGLFITRELIVQHGGRIWLKSEPGVGTTFYVALPLTSEACSIKNL